MQFYGNPYYWILFKHPSQKLNPKLILQNNKLNPDYWYENKIRADAEETSQIVTFIGPHGAHLGPVSPRWAPCGPHEPCYQGYSRWCILSPGSKISVPRRNNPGLANTQFDLTSPQQSEAIHCQWVPWCKLSPYALRFWPNLAFALWLTKASWRIGTRYANVNIVRRHPHGRRVNDVTNYSTAILFVKMRD